MSFDYLPLPGETFPWAFPPYICVPGQIPFGISSRHVESPAAVPPAVGDKSCSRHGSVSEVLSNMSREPQTLGRIKSTTVSLGVFFLSEVKR